jgi:hypothetical protein
MTALAGKGQKVLMVLAPTFIQQKAKEGGRRSAYTLLQ